MPLNTPADVARYIVQVGADPTAHGKALFVTGGQAVDIEAGLDKTEPQWLGEKNSRDLNAGQVILGFVSLTRLELLLLIWPPVSFCPPRTICESSPFRHFLY
jgi:hypothetical protein